MRFATATLLCLALASTFAAIDGVAQQTPAAPSQTDPRVGLKPGFTNAGVAAKNMVLLSNTPRPTGFFDPKSPAGTATPPEAPTAPAGAAAAALPTPAPTPAPAPAAPAAPAAPSGLDFANSDLAFSRNHVFMGNFNGFNAWDIDSTKRPRLASSVVCPGGQGDMSVYGHLLFMSVEQTRGRVDCGTQGVTATVSPERFRGIRIFDVTDISKPKQIAAIQTCRGSHTHTLVTDPKDKDNIYVYGSGTGAVRDAQELADCSGKDPKDDPNTSLFSIDVIKVPLAAPQQAAVVNRPRLFADVSTGNISGLWQGGDFGPGTQTSRATDRCHDITVFPAIGLAAGACAGNGLLIDISDPVHPVRLDAVVDKNFAFWHSATFNNDGTKVIFTDEWGGGTRPRCRATDLPNWGADAIFDIVDKKLKFAGYYKMPAVQTEQENCVAHNGSLLPVPGRDIMAQGWYQGGISIFDFTDSAHPVEIAYFDRGPIDAKDLITGGFWSAYWYNGHLYGSEIARGIDIFDLTPSEYLSRDEIDAAILIRDQELNVQDQQKLSWPAQSVVARAYLDQLGRAKAIQSDLDKSVRSTLANTDKVRSSKDKGAAAAVTQLNDAASKVEAGATAASGNNQKVMKSLAETLRAIGDRLK